MLVQRNGLIVSSLSFAATFYFINGVFERLCDREDNSEQQTELIWELREVDSRQISRSKPRDDFVYTIEPWKVQKRMESKEFDCHRTTKNDLMKLVIFIKSAANYSSRRESVRATWGKISHLENMIVHTVFVIGMTTRKVQSGIETENSRYGDILQFVGIDDYRHISYKVLAGMQWAKENLKKDYFYVTSDDDLLVNMTDLPKKLRLRMRLTGDSLPKKVHRTRENIMANMPILCIYSYREKEPPVRSIHGTLSKYYMDRREYPMEYLPTFCLGGFYMMPVERAGKLYDASKIKRALPMDDVWITGILRFEISPKHIDAIDKSAVSPKSNFITHLRGDVDDSHVIVWSEVLHRWDNIYKSIEKKKHCLRDEFDA